MIYISESKKKKSTTGLPTGTVTLKYWEPLKILVERLIGFTFHSRFYHKLIRNQVVEILDTNRVNFSILTSMVGVPRFRCLLIPKEIVVSKKIHVQIYKGIL